MRNLFSFLYPLFGYCLSGLYHWTHNYGVALILLTLFARILMLPMSIKQQKSTAKMQRLQTKVRKIQQQYAGDQKKIQEETQALYTREGTNPMSMGCLPLLLQLPIIYGLIGAIYHPLQYVLHIPDATNKAIAGALGIDTKPIMFELTVLGRINELKTIPNGVTADVIETIRSFNFKFLGLPLGEVPDLSKPSVLWAVPILAFLSQMASALFMYMRQKEQNPGMAKNPSMGCMTFGMPLFSLFLTFKFPVGVGIYWIASSVIAFVQTVVLNSIYSPKMTTTKLLVEETIRRRSREQNLMRVAEQKQSND